MGRERRRRTRRQTAPQRSSALGMIPGEVEAAPSREGSTRTTSSHDHVQVRSDRAMARETATMISEMKRVVLVSGVCFGMLAVLVVVERLQ